MRKVVQYTVVVVCLFGITMFAGALAHMGMELYAPVGELLGFVLVAALLCAAVVGAKCLMERLRPSPPGSDHSWTTLMEQDDE